METLARRFPGRLMRVIWEVRYVWQAPMRLWLIMMTVPFPHPDSTIPLSVTPRATFDAPASVITRAIRSFPNGSAGGLDKLQPQHLKDLLASVDDIEESPFVSALAGELQLV